ncbi:MAG: protein-L-isoaspartate(D-aspartate) O-methyltransferase [Anaerolineaceae bacterium]|nr:protein-L-isoaspartate(D-aspartate) O-methyltransferase [Anaerolineaceae bacterium]
MENEALYSREREEMVREQIERRHVRDARVLTAMRAVPRHLFVTQEYQGQAYDDCPLPIAQSQTISQPYMVAVMSSLLELQGTERVLEIGTGSGYQAAVLARLAAEVHTVERHPQLATAARQVLNSLSVRNVVVHCGDGSLGWPSYAPYQGIMVTAATPGLAQALLEQLADGGFLVAPVGGHGSQDLQRWQRVGARFEMESIFPVAFVPLRGEGGWKEGEW